MEDLLQYLDEVVDPTIKDFEANPTSSATIFSRASLPFILLII